MEATLPQDVQTGASSLAGRVALVTGGARGLGEQICRTLARAGARIAIVDLRNELAQAVAGSLKETGADSHVIAADIGSPDQAQRAIQNAAEHFGAVDILINNAAVDNTVSIEELSVEDWERIMRVNLTGAFLMSKFAFPEMKRRGRGHIVNIVSTASKRAWPNASAYHASKWGLLGLSHALHTEARPHGVKVTAVVAGGMRTPFLLDRFPGLDPDLLQDPRNVAETVKFVLLQPEETVIPEVMVLPMRETSWP